MTSNLMHAQPIDEFNGGKWRVMYVTAPGTIPVMTKDGLTQAPYSAGDAILLDEGGTIIAGPVNLTGAVDLAERVLDCNPHVRTDTRTVLALATAMVAFASTDPAPDPESPAPAMTTEQAIAEVTFNG